MIVFTVYCFFFKQKTAYEMRISDWSSDVCSSDLRHARRVGVPVEQVEGEGVLAHQVVVHHEGPDEVIGAQQVEGGRHVGALEVAIVLHLLLEGSELHLVDEDAELACLIEVHHRREGGVRLHPPFLFENRKESV